MSVASAQVSGICCELLVPQKPSKQDWGAGAPRQTNPNRTSKGRHPAPRLSRSKSLQYISWFSWWNSLLSRCPTTSHCLHPSTSMKRPLTSSPESKMLLNPPISSRAGPWYCKLGPNLSWNKLHPHSYRHLQKASSPKARANEVEPSFSETTRPKVNEGKQTTVSLKLNAWIPEVSI